MTYQGWKNWETWNVALWLGNEESFYRAAQGFKKRHGRFTGPKAKDFVLGLMPEGTPDMSDLSPAKVHDAYGKVSWTEISKDLNGF